MIRLQQPPLFSSSKPMAVEIEVIPLDQYHIEMKHFTYDKL